MNLVDRLYFYTAATLGHNMELVQHPVSRDFPSDTAYFSDPEEGWRQDVCLHSQHFLSSEKPLLFFLQLYEVKPTHDRLKTGTDSTRQLNQRHGPQFLQFNY